MADDILRITDLTVAYPAKRRHRRPPAVGRVSLSVTKGGTVGLVGESGSGKTPIGAAVLGMAPVTAGSIVFDGEEIAHASASRRRQLSKRLQVVFQAPYSSLNPSRTIGQTLVEPMLAHGGSTRSQARTRVEDMLEKVGLDRAVTARYPNHFSGGQRQRIAIARALMLSPDLIICDEAVSALDLSVQAQVLNLLLTLQQE